MSSWEEYRLTTVPLEAGGYQMKVSGGRRERIQQRWDARLLQRFNQHTAPAKGSPRRPGRL